jgi:hypothetical protein
MYRNGTKHCNRHSPQKKVTGSETCLHVARRRLRGCVLFAVVPTRRDTQESTGDHCYRPRAIPQDQELGEGGTWHGHHHGGLHP